MLIALLTATAALTFKWCVYLTPHDHGFLRFLSVLIPCLAVVCAIFACYTWHAAWQLNRESKLIEMLNENVRIQRMLKDFIEVWPHEKEASRPCDTSIGGLIHFLSDDWVTQLHNAEKDGRKTRSRCLLYLERTRAMGGDFPSGDTDVSKASPTRLLEFLQEDERYLREKIKRPVKPLGANG